MLDLLDYRRTVFDLYTEVRGLGSDSPRSHARFREVRDGLFRDHPQSPLDGTQKAQFKGLKYYNYNPAYRVVGAVQPVQTKRLPVIDLGPDGHMQLVRVGLVALELPTGSGELDLYWIEGYGGGLFLPFRDRTNGVETYGGGRYLYDTIKGADLGAIGEKIVLDFNYAYHPSCFYNDRWVCPLAPQRNRLGFPVPVGEKAWTGGQG